MKTNWFKATVSAAAVALVAVSFPSAAAAQTTDEGRIYVSAGAGWQHRERAGESPTTYTDLKKGHALNFAAGYEQRRFAFEGEVSFLNNDTDRVAATVTGEQEGVGDISLRFFMANVRYTFSDAPLRPYVGGGLGAYKSYLHGVSNVVAQSFGFEADGTSDGLTFAYQLRAGLSLRAGDRADVLVGYRYLRGSELLFEGTEFGDLRPNGAKIHSLEAALKFNF